MTLRLTKRTLLDLLSKQFKFITENTKLIGEMSSAGQGLAQMILSQEDKADVLVIELELLEARVSMLESDIARGGKDVRG